MNRIPINEAVGLAKRFGGDIVVIIAFDKYGGSAVTTYGRERKQSRWAAALGNKVKALLEWPKTDCNARPLERVCGNCVYYTPDYGIHAFNGWTDDGSRGECMVDTHSRETMRERCACREFEGKDWG